MLAGFPTPELLKGSDRPDLRVIAEERNIRLISTTPGSFRVRSDGTIDISEDAVSHNTARYQAFVLRHALELASLLDGMPELSPERWIVRASFAASRTAALFYGLDAGSPDKETRKPDWVDLLGDDTPLQQDAINELWPMLRLLLPVPSHVPKQLSGQDLEDLTSWLDRSWGLIGPTETLMATGGDARLLLDPRTGLNHYGCSHRPRPWAITFASSTASSVSERGFAGAEKARQRLQRALIRDDGEVLLAALASEARMFLASYFNLPGEDRVVLAPSGTDCELAALAISLLGAGTRPVTNILIAPDETGSGVPLAAAGRHFADDTARRSKVVHGEIIDGFGFADPENREARTEVEAIRLREANGDAVAPDILADRCREQIAGAIARGHHILLHQLDLSKTGLLAPDEETLENFEQKFGERIDIVVDACQDRLTRERIGNWVARGRAVMITGSKFITGPPFCGALLLPAHWRKRLNHGGLPAGLSDYAGRTEWPACQATENLPQATNCGLTLRWHAAIAEMEAFRAVPATETRMRLERFLREVRSALTECDDIALLEAPVPVRPALPGAWDDMTTILSFLVRAPDSGIRNSLRKEEMTPLGLADARRLYRWLNADLSHVFAANEPERVSGLARLLCHIGQPVAVPSAALGGACAGALRISAGARLVSGEPSHRKLDTDLRLAREIDDAREVIAKIGLIRRHWDRILAVDPLPTYAPLQDVDKIAGNLLKQNGDV
ncbi:hypothetical protein [Acetobacter oeni]|uniref:Uncharacterized protein n=1 Tax=Acetobacter oeni TaxID=304077 RepID=A0A511XK92_9PROT|nr:hypothetical protein [Acetobacter oeni]MBB3883158.1 hypothetical protein [Acetobacter oeni]NHO19202.1 hypothetical protein [Acetobacter oeni]GBR05138.1 hypothetical protein AA21952_1635 [Acetobacter oeni LMG 21952]GEN63338.1 hypothetical protein AOE01nite_15620 [Acetobacter oeni]